MPLFIFTRFMIENEELVPNKDRVLTDCIITNYCSSDTALPVPQMQRSDKQCSKGPG